MSFINRELLRKKSGASGVHLGISGLIFLVLLYFILFRWYPQPWFAIDGGWQGVRIMILVDMVLGPTLTFLVFNPAKTRLALTIDFGFIAVVQAAALAWGIYAVHHERPLAIAYWDGGYYSVGIDELQKQGLAAKDLQKFGGKFPVMVGVRTPQFGRELNNMLGQALSKNLSPYQLVSFYIAQSEMLDKIFARQMDIKSFVKDHPPAKKLLDQFLTKHSAKLEDYRYMSFFGPYANATLVLTPTGEVADVLPPLKEWVPPQSEEQAQKSGGKPDVKSDEKPAK